MTNTITTITNFKGDEITTSITVVPTTITYCSKTYRQCQGTAWDGSGQCSSCGAYMGTGGVCLALVELTIQQKKHAECPCCECT